VKAKGGRTCVAVDIAVSAGAVAVGNVPGLAALDVGGGGSVVRVAAALRGGQLGGEDPQIGRAGVEIEVESLLVLGHLDIVICRSNILCFQQ